MRWRTLHRRRRRRHSHDYGRTFLRLLRLVRSRVGRGQSIEEASGGRLACEWPDEVVTAGADVTRDGVAMEVFRRPPRLTLDEFRRLRWEQAEGGVVTDDPAHVPLIEKFLAAKGDPERLRAFIEQELGGEWQEEPCGSAGPSQG